MGNAQSDEVQETSTSTRGTEQESSAYNLKLDSAAGSPRPSVGLANPDDTAQTQQVEESKQPGQASAPSSAPSLRSQVRSLSDKILALERQAGVPTPRADRPPTILSALDETGRTVRPSTPRVSTARSILNSFRAMTSNTSRGLAHSDVRELVAGTQQLSVATALGQLGQVKALAKHADVNTRDADGDRYPVHWAAARNNVRALELLLGAGADADMRDADGRTAAELAAATGAAEAHARLVYGPTIDDPKRMGETMQRDALSLHCALNMPKELARILDFCSNAQANPSRRDADGDRTPLHWAAARGASKCAQLLLEAGADAHALDADGRMPAELALRCNQRLTAALILEGAAVRQGAAVRVADPPVAASVAMTAGAAVTADGGSTTTKGMRSLNSSRRTSPCSSESTAATCAVTSDDALQVV